MEKNSGRGKYATLKTQGLEADTPCACVCVLSHFSHIQLCAALWTCQAPRTMGFSKQEYWSGLKCPPLENLPDPGIETKSFTSSALAGGFFTPSTTGKP